MSVIVCGLPRLLPMIFSGALDRDSGLEMSSDSTAFGLPRSNFGLGQAQISWNGEPQLIQLMAGVYGTRAI